MRKYSGSSSSLKDSSPSPSQAPNEIGGSLSDSDSDVLSERLIASYLNEMPTMRKIGGVDQGKFFKSSEEKNNLDGFEDYKLFIQL